MDDTKARRRRPTAVVSLLLVFVLAGLMLAVAAQQARITGSRQPESLVQLVRQRSDKVGDLTAEVRELQARADALVDSQDAALPRLPEATAAAQDLASASSAVTGPALSVSLSDATDQNVVVNGVAADDLLVHQQDVEAVVNALWAGGAEAMTIQGERVTPLTAVRCVGNVLLLHGQVYSPPYTVVAIGNTDALRAALDADAAVQVYREYVAAYGLGWQVETVDAVDMPAASAALSWASLPDGIDPFAVTRD